MHMCGRQWGQGRSADKNAESVRFVIAAKRLFGRRPPPARAAKARTGRSPNSTTGGMLHVRSWHAVRCMLHVGRCTPLRPENTMLIYNAWLTERRILILGRDVPAGDVCELVLERCRRIRLIRP